jgi:hypothetical protein
MVKMFEALGGVGPAMMDSLHEERVGAPSGVRDWAGNQQLLPQNAYLAAEDRIPRAQLPTRLRLTDPQRSTLAKSASGSAH